jgi:phenylalanyl-tRNA synthetase alpha chain
LKNSIELIRTQAVKAIEEAADVEALEDIRVRYLGRKGKLSELLSQMDLVPLEERPIIGKLANELKGKLSELIAGKARSLTTDSRGQAEATDMSLPGLIRQPGYKHPITQTIEEICEIFCSMGFRIVDGPEIDTEYYNFEVLNIPLEHPSRDAFDTFYIKDDILLRSQTSTMQGRIMEKQKPPLRILAPGKVYRPDAVDATHSFIFHQIEGFAVDEGIKFSDLKGTLDVFVKGVFGKTTRTRFSPHFFPFTEPSAEVEISCILCRQKGCKICKGTGWLEILGCGMINPAVLRMVGYPRNKYSGFAFGMGVERIAMLKYGIDDIRLFYENDLRFLMQF